MQKVSVRSVQDHQPMAMQVYSRWDLEGMHDFLECLEPDMALKILTCLDDSADLVRASAVSRYWQKVVVSNGLCKQLCMRTFPQLGSITRVVEPSHDNLGKSEHRAYASLFRAITAFPLTFCIADPVSASSTGYPKDSIKNTICRGSYFKTICRGSYWLSRGSDDPETPETLIYNLSANFCVVTEINLHLRKGWSGYPIYSSRFVRFRMGHPKSVKDLNYDFIKAQECADDKFIWTYTSPMFPVTQENLLQKFRLPAPVVCIGGYLQIELLGRVSKSSDDKYYICVAQVEAIGRTLSPLFSVAFSESSDDVHLKYDAEEFGYILSTCGSISRVQLQH
ncbi:putative F-box domain-containing protein [Helianthus annuus]|nr:putative F-box domain-containing protein [Helianthus annuus]